MVTVRPVQIVVVDDEQEFTHALVLLLQNAGYQTAHAYDGDSALALMRRCRPLAIVTDLAMPGRNGYRLLAELRADASCRNVFAVALPGWGGQDAATKAKAAGFDAYFMKPCEHVKLLAVLKLAIEAATPIQNGCGGGGTGW